MTINSLIYSAIALTVFIAGWTVNGWRWESTVSSMKQEYAETLEHTTREAKETQEQLAGKLASIDEQKTKELNDARTEIDRLNDAVAVGSASLRVNATCGSELPKSGSGSGVGNGSGPRLTESAQRSYFTLRERIIQVTAQLSACQEILRNERN